MLKMLGRRPWTVIVSGCVFAFLLVSGVQIEWGHSCNYPLTVLLTVLLTVPLAVLLRHLFELRMPEQKEENAAFSFRCSFLFLVVCYIPMMLILFPGAFAYDVPFQLRQVLTGEYSTHHPLIHTLFLGAFIQIGKALGHVNLGAALYTIAQILLTALCFAGCGQSIFRQRGARAARTAVIFYALYPLHMIMAGNATKDTLFSGTFALTLCLLFQGMQKELSRGEKLTFFIALLLCTLLRNNAFPALLVWAVFALLISGRGKRRMAASVLAVLCIAQGIGLGLQTGLHAVSGDIVEMLAWPIQQIARVRLYCPEKLDEDEIYAIDQAMPDEIWRAYDPTISDPVKFGMNSSVIQKNPGKYLQLYLSVLKKCPAECMDAVLELTHGFLFPYLHYSVSGYYLQMSVSNLYYDGWWEGERIRDMSLFPALRSALNWRFGAQGAMQWPVLGMFFNMGCIVYVMLFLVFRRLYMRTVDCVAALIPVLLLGTYLLGPCMAGRYIYPFVCVLPVLGGKLEEKDAP